MILILSINVRPFFKTFFYFLTDTGDVYVVITKYDLVKDQAMYDCGSDEKMVSISAFNDVETKVAEVFNIQGALQDNRIRWVSYTDRVKMDNPYIDNIALKFIKRMVMPVNQPDVEHVKPVMNPAIKMKLEARKLWKDSNFTFSQIVIIIVVIIVALMLFKLLTAPL